MSSIKRGLRSLGRNRSRNLLVTTVLGLSVALVLVVFAVEKGVSLELTEIEGEVGTLIEIRPIGSYGLRVEEPLDAGVLPVINSIEGISRVSPYVISPLPLDPQLFGETGGERQGGMSRYFAFGIGVDQDTVLYFGGALGSIITGRSLHFQDIEQGVAVVGLELANEFDLAVGSLLPLDPEQEPIEVVGIFEGSSRLLSRGVFMPYQSVQRFWGEAGELHHVMVEAQSLSHVDGVAEELRLLLGPDVDVVSQKDALTGHLDERLDSLHSILRLVLIMSLALVGVVVLVTMILSARERSAEIGILKALGAFRKDIVTQFGIESLCLSVGGYLIGLLIYLWGGSSMASMLTRMSSTGAAGTATRTGGMMGGRGMFSTSLDIGTIEANLSLEMSLYVLAAIILLGLVGGILPGWYASYFKPAEVLRRG